MKGKTKAYSKAQQSWRSGSYPLSMLPLNTPPRTATDLIFICITSCQRRLGSNYSTVTRRHSSSTGSPWASLLVPVGELIPAHHQEREKNPRTAMFSPVQCSQDPTGSVLKSFHSQIARMVPAHQQQHAVPACQGGICSVPQPQPAAVDAFDLTWGNPGSKCISAAPRSKRSNRHYKREHSHPGTTNNTGPADCSPKNFLCPMQSRS